MTTIDINSAAEAIAQEYGLDAASVLKTLQAKATAAVPAYQAFANMICEATGSKPNTAIRPFEQCCQCCVFACQADHDYLETVEELIFNEKERAAAQRVQVIKLHQQTHPETIVLLRPPWYPNRSYRYCTFSDEEEDVLKHYDLDKKTLGELDLTKMSVIFAEEGFYIE
jgi:hypothetical protein